MAVEVEVADDGGSDQEIFFAVGVGELGEGEAGVGMRAACQG